MENQFDLVVIGAGPGGYTAAQHAAKNGLRTALIERSELGGTCVNLGCIPTKSLMHTTILYDMMCHSEQLGISVSQLHFDYTKLFSQKDTAVLRSRKEIFQQCETLGIVLLQGDAMILAPHQVCVTSEDGASQTLITENILIATGAKPAKPPIPGIDLPNVITSADILSTPQWHYDRLTILGGGVVGVELAVIFRNLGAEVTIIEKRSHLLSPIDYELTESLETLLLSRGIQVYTGVCSCQISETEQGLCCHFLQSDDTSKNLFSDRILAATGRCANLDGLFAPDLEIEFTNGKLAVNGYFETSIPGIYAIGDVLEEIQLAHLAAAQATYVVDILCRKSPSVLLSAVPSGSFVDLPIVPSCIYIQPEIASVGISEKAAETYGISVRCGRCEMHRNSRSIISGSEGGFIKLVFESHSHGLIGAQMFCPRATDMIGEMATAIANGLTANQLMFAMRAHPTYNEAIAQAVQDSGLLDE